MAAWAANAARLAPVSARIEDRIAQTLELVARRGYALPPEQVARLLHGGPVAPSLVVDAIGRVPNACLNDGLLYLLGDEDRVPESLARQRGHAYDAPEFEAIAREYASALISYCPWIDAVLLAGSLASGGFLRHDDIDFNLVVPRGTKYTTYLLAVIVGVAFAWRHRGRATLDEAHLPFLPKLTCINVVWERDQMEPFERQDAYLAFELLLAKPLHGASVFRQILDANPVLVWQFPQMMEGEAKPDAPPRSRRTGRLLAFLLSRPALRRSLDNAAFLVVKALHAAVRWARRSHPAALRRVDYVESFKHPYGILDHPRSVKT